MDQQINITELLLRPAFTVEDGRITRINREASGYMLEEGTDIRSLIEAGLEEYDSFQSGKLSLTLCIHGQQIPASVEHIQQGQLFLLEPDGQDARLQTMSLVARTMRDSLSGMSAAAEGLTPGDSQLNRRIYQMHRIINNMSDTVRFATQPPRLEYVDAVALVKEIMDRASALAEDAGYHLQLSAPSEIIYTLADRELLERAIFNLLSNAMKFSPVGYTIRATLARQGNRLRFTLEDSGCGIAADLQSSLFDQYTRQPGLEDPSHGLGLGMLLVRLAAAAHGGTVLIDHPKDTGTRITLTFAIRQASGNAVRSPILRPDYAGGRDHALIELSDVLPASLYENEKLR